LRVLRIGSPDSLMTHARKKILCIEDDRETAALIAEELLDRGYEVIVTHDGREGLAAILRVMPDVVLSDISMPAMSGRRLGADDYVTKPIDFDLLAVIIEARLKAVARTGLWPKAVDLNDREVEVLTWVARGKTSAETAQILGLTKRTVDFHTDNARAKLGAATRTEAAIKAATGKLIEP